MKSLLTSYWFQLLKVIFPVTYGTPDHYSTTPETEYSAPNCRCSIYGYKMWMYLDGSQGNRLLKNTHLWTSHMLWKIRYSRDFAFLRARKFLCLRTLLLRWISANNKRQIRQVKTLKWTPRVRRWACTQKSFLVGMYSTGEIQGRFCQ